MALIRAFTRMDTEGKIALPRNIRIALDLEVQDTVELKVGGPNRSKQVIVSKRKEPRLGK